MTAIAPPTIVVAMEQLDSEVAVLIERRRLLQQLLATFDDADGNTVEPTPAWTRVEVERESPEALNERFSIVDAEPVKPKPQPKATGTRPAKWNYVEVAQVLAAGVEAGKSASGSLVQHYGVNSAMAGYLMKRCRELGYTRDPKVSFVPTPIERTPFDPQVARDATAGPSTGRVRPLPGAPGRRTDLEQKEAPAVEERAPRFGVEDALQALEAS
jgi:hypothetical protein